MTGADFLLSGTSATSYSHSVGALTLLVWSYDL